MNFVFNRTFLCSILLALLPVLASAQRQDRIIEWERYHAPAASKLEALDVVCILVDGRAFHVGQPFPAGDDWLKGLIVRVRNISGVPIRDLRIGVVFPETTVGGGALGLALFNPELHRLASSSGAKILKPAEEIDLVLTEGQYKTLLKASARRGRTQNLTKVLLKANPVVKFENAAEVFCSFRLLTFVPAK